MKKYLAIILACLMLVSVFAGCGGTDPDPGTGTTDPEVNDPGPGTDPGTDSDLPIVKIGVFEPATGDSGSGGKKETLGMQYANSETPTVEIGGTTYQVQLVYADNGSDQAKAPSAASQLVSEGVALVLGSYGSGVSMAGGPIFDEAGLAALGVTCTNPNVTAGNDYYFRICFLDPFQGTVLANYAMSELGAGKAYCLGEVGNEYDQGLITYFKQAFEAAGGTVVVDSFPKDNSDFNSYLNKAKSEDVDVFFCPVSIAYSTQIISQADLLGVDFPFLGGDTLDDNMVLAAAKDSDIVLYVTTFYSEGGNPDFDAGIKAYINGNPQAKTANGGDDTISAVTTMGYDAYYVALEAMKAAGSIDPAAIKTALPGVTYNGVSGAIAFDDIGDAIRDTAYIKTTDNAAGIWRFVTQHTIT